MQRTFQTAVDALEQADTTLQSIEQLSSQDSQVMFTLTATLEEIALAARSIRTVADYLERHPESLLRGKGGKGGN
jgi:paraquat-inducible protein B